MLAKPSRARCTSYPPSARVLAGRARGGELGLSRSRSSSCCAPLLVQRGERVVQDALPDLAHEPVVEVQVVLAEQVPAQRLVRLRQVVEIGARVVLAGRAGAAGVQRLVRVLVHAAAELQVAPRGEDAAALAEGRRQDAVEHVEPAVHGLEQVERACRRPSGSAACPVAFARPSARRRPAARCVPHRPPARRSPGRRRAGRTGTRRSRRAGLRRALPARCRTATGPSRPARRGCARPSGG